MYAVPIRTRVNMNTITIGIVLGITIIPEI